VTWALLASLGTLLAAGGARAQTRAPKAGDKDDKLYQKLLATVQTSSTLKKGWFVSGPTYDVHSTISREYTAMAAVHLDKFHRRFTSIFREPFKDSRKPVAYGFATEKEYLEFSPGSKGTQGRFLVMHDNKGIKKDLAWFALPPGETDFYQTDYGVV
jgi:hypothetical protein